MANQKPYYTSTDLIEAVKRKISIPLSQETFSENDILLFANEETYLSQVPSILLYHQEYFVFPVVVPLLQDVSRYPIPDRAIGLRMRDVMYQDDNQNLFEMTRVDAADKAFFQRNVGANSAIHKFYIEGNEVVLLPQVVGQVSGSIVFYIFLRPNQLVVNNRAAILQSVITTPSQIKKNLLANSTFVQINPTNTFTIPLHGFNNGNHLTFQSSGILPAGMLADTLYYVVNSSANTFQISLTIGGSPIVLTDVGTGVHTVTRTKLLKISFRPGDIDFTIGTITVVNHDFVNGNRVLLSSTNLLPTPLTENTFYYVVGSTSNTIQLSATLGGPPINITYNGEGLHYISTDISTLTFDQVPTNITNSSLIDFLQTNTGHRTYDYDVQVPSNGISGTTISFHTPDIPTSFIIGDYICTANECIIPQIPSDLHNGLAERTSARILASIGDAAGLAAVQQKISEIDKSQGSLLDNRAEGNPQKVLARHSLLRYGRFFGRRRV
jgi:hypothetical protein